MPSVEEEIVHVVAGWEEGKDLAKILLRLVPLQDDVAAYRVTVNGRLVEFPCIIHAGDKVILWPAPLDMDDPFAHADVIGLIVPFAGSSTASRVAAWAMIGVLAAGTFALLVHWLALAGP